MYTFRVGPTWGSVTCEAGKFERLDDDDVLAPAGESKH